jgi:hypothetical protein
MALPNSKRDPAQLPMWQFVIKQQKEHTEDLLKQYADMAGRADDDLQTVKWKEEKYKALRESELSRRLSELANVWLSTYFGNQVEEIDYEELQNHLSPNRFPDWQDFRGQEWFKRAQALAAEKRFFHWELEFPEAFSGKENPGFDVVIGNPPYVRQERLGDDKPYFENVYKTYHGVADLYVYFIEKAHELLKNGGNFGFISSNKFVRSNYGGPLRNYLKESVHIKQIIDFGELPVFPEAATFPAIYLTEKEKPTSSSVTIYTKVLSLDFKSLDSLIASNGLSLSSNSFKGDNWALVKDDDAAIMQKMKTLSDPLEKYTKNGIKRGIVTGLNEAFIIDQFTKKRLISEDQKSG